MDQNLKIAQYERVYAPLASLEYSINSNLHGVLQPRDAEGHKIGRPFLLGKRKHRELMRFLPRLFPHDEGLIKRAKVDITRGYYKSDWVELGFKTRREGEDFIQPFRQRGADLSSKEKVRALVLEHAENFQFLDPELITTAHDGFESSYKLSHHGKVRYTQYFNSIIPELEKLISQHTGGEARAVSIMLQSRVEFIKNDYIEVENQRGFTHFFQTPSMLVLPGDHESISRGVIQLMEEVEQYLGTVSNLEFRSVKISYLHIANANLVAGSSFIDLPKDLKGPNRKLINPKNEDNLCFLYAVSALLNYEEIGRDHQRVSKLRKYLPAFNPDDFPMVANPRKIAKYEELFQANIHILHYYGNPQGEKPLHQKITPLVASKASYPRDVHLLLLTEGEKTHYVGIRDLSALLSSSGSSPKDKHHYCMRCLHSTTSITDHEMHKRDCGSDLQKTRMPTALKRKKGECDEAFIQRLKASSAVPRQCFKGWHKTIRKPVNVYADFEAFQLKDGKQKVNSAFYVAIDCYERRIIKEAIFHGENCVREFIDSIKDLGQEIYGKYFEQAKEMSLTQEEKSYFHEARENIKRLREGEEAVEAPTCCFCRKHINYLWAKGSSTNTLSLVRHHCHYTGEFIGLAHSNCNLQAKTPTSLNVFFHNFKGYDSHSLIKELRRSDYDTISILPDNEEKWKAFTLKYQHKDDLLPWPENPGGKLAKEVGYIIDENTGVEVKNAEKYWALIRFIHQSLSVKRHNTMCQHSIIFLDSMSFLTSSLDSVSKSMTDNEFVYSKEWARDEASFQLLRKKGSYPYESCSAPAYFEQTSLPPKEDFISHLSHGTRDYEELVEQDRKELDEGYQHAQAMWRHFGMRTFQEYHDLYLKTDVYLLADVFERFRGISLKSFELDPSHYYTLPGLGIDACYKHTGAMTELLTDEAMYIFFEASKIGGVSSVFSKRFAQAKNSYLDPTHDNEREDTSYIQYNDYNSLYAWAMQQKLPYSGFKWLKQPHNFDLVTNADGKRGYFVEVDAYLPDEYHDSQADYPALPEMLIPTKDMLSPAQLQTYTKDAPVPKLCPNLLPKSHYKLDLRLLQFYIKCGWVVTKIHRVLTYVQKAWMAPYINHCIDQRKVASTEFEKDFWKLMCNAVFGRTLMDVRRFSRVELLSKSHDKAKFKRLTKHNAIRKGPLPTPIEENGEGDMYSINVVKTSVTLNSPIFAGASILCISKLQMHRFWYDVLKPKYGDKVSLLYSDTDSFIYQVFTKDVYKDMEGLRDQFDFSNYPSSHPLYSTVNKKVTGKMKDETAGVPIYEFCGLRSKLYSIKTLQYFSKDGKPTTELHTGKGIWRKILEHHLRHEEYKRGIFHEGQAENISQKADMWNLVCKRHTMVLQKTNKVTLHAHDDKRYLLEDGVTQLPFGHYSLRV